MSNRMGEKNRAKADEDYELVCLCQKGDIAIRVEIVSKP